MAQHAHKAARLIGTLLVVVALAGLWTLARLQPVHTGGEETVIVEVAPGSSSQSVANLLYTHGLIKSPVVFRYYARYRKLDNQLKPGEYELSPGMSAEQILQHLSRGEVLVRRFTIPEGYTVAQIADLLAEKGMADRERFLRAAKESKLAEKYLPQGVALEQPLEGYLFPATYEVKPEMTEPELLAMMFTRFEQVWTPELLSRAQEMNLTVHQVITLASIVEREARVPAEQAIISGVYHNRMRIGMKLDADPTVRYGVGKPPQEDLTYADLDSDSPYNTYRMPGLPPGPIASPGEAAIQAALNPAQHDFWYFVAKADGSGEHYFASTLEEQGENIARAAANANANK